MLVNSPLLHVATEVVSEQGAMSYPLGHGQLLSHHAS